MNRAWRILLILCVLGLVAVGGAGAWYQRQVNPPGALGAQISVKIPEGSSPNRIATILHRAGVIDNEQVFKLYLRLNGVGDLKAGDYGLRQNADFGDIVEALKKGPKHDFDRLTIPEGFTLKQIAELVGKLPGRSSDEFLEVAASGRVRSKFQPDEIDTLEGLMFPDTYFIDRTDSEEAILTRLVATFDKVAAEEGLGDEARRVQEAHRGVARRERGQGRC